VPEPLPDPRVYFAAERTMLAWLRTGIGIMAFGFVVARFGLFFRLLRATEGAPSHGISPYLGASLVGIGVVTTAAGAIQYRRFCSTLPPDAKPSTANPGFLLGVSWALVLIGIVLGLVLIL
jgi:putative membrane protein